MLFTRNIEFRWMNHPAIKWCQQAQPGQMTWQGDARHHEHESFPPGADGNRLLFTYEDVSVTFMIRDAVQQCTAQWATHLEAQTLNCEVWQETYLLEGSGSEGYDTI